jgi:uncharacterized protein YdaU (DUF1376 family)
VKGVVQHSKAGKATTERKKLGALKWYKRDPRAALLGMMGLTLEERGVYNTLIDLIYMADGALPDNARVICRVLCINARRWKRLRDSLVAHGKIYLLGGCLHNERADIEAKDALARVAIRKVSRKFDESFSKDSSKFRKVNDRQSH